MKKQPEDKQLSKERLTQLADSYQRQAIETFIRFWLERGALQKSIERVFVFENEHVNEYNKTIEEHRQLNRKLSKLNRERFLRETRVYHYGAAAVGFYGLYLGVVEGFSFYTHLIVFLAVFALLFSFYCWWKSGRLEQFKAKKAPVTMEQAKERLVEELFNTLYNNENQRNEITEAYSEGHLKNTP